MGTKFYIKQFLKRQKGVLFTVDHLGELLYKCEACNLEFKRSNHLLRHKTLVHLGQKFSCVICGKEWASEKPLANHLRQVHNLTKKKLKEIEKEVKKEEKKAQLSQPAAELS